MPNVESSVSKNQEKCITLLSERHGSWRMVSREEGLVAVERRSSVAELELDVGRGEVREPRRALLEASRREVHGEAPHLARGAEEGTPAHGGQLLQTPFLGPLVLEPHLRETKCTVINQRV